MTIMMPDKYFYTIGDVSRMTKIKSHVLRYWENHFKVLRPARRYSGHRKYTQREIDLIQQIRDLVVNKKFTLSGAQREISRLLNPRHKKSQTPTIQATPANLPILKEMKKDVEACLDLLETSGA